MAQDEQEQAAQEASTEDPEGEAERAGEEVQPVNVYGILGYCIALLQAHAWQSMGLLPNPATRTIAKDMEQARTAIDSIAALMPLMEGRIPGAEMRQLRTMLSDLQMNFVSQQAREQ